MDNIELFVMDEVHRTIEDMSELQKYIVLLLDANNNIPIKGNTWFQKELFLVAKNIRDVDEEASFVSDMFGPYSENAQEQLEDLEMDEIVSKSKSKMWLSNFGLRIAKELKKVVPEYTLEMISEFKETLNDLNDDELLTFIYFTFPNFTDESLVIDKIKKNRVLNAIRLYKKGKVSLQKASEIANVPLENFIGDVLL